MFNDIYINIILSLLGIMYILVLAYPAKKIKLKDNLATEVIYEGIIDNIDYINNFTYVYFEDGREFKFECYPQYPINIGDYAKFIIKQEEGFEDTIVGDEIIVRGV